MKKIHLPKKPKELYIPLLQIQMEKEFEEEILKAVLPYKEPPFAKKREGKVFREALQKHVWDPNFRHIWKSPKVRLLSILKAQWLVAKDFYPVIFWLWKCAQEELFAQLAQWLEEHQPDAIKLYAEDYEGAETREDLLCNWAETYSKATEEQPRVKFTMALISYMKQHPDIFTKFEEDQNPVEPSTPEPENGNQDQYRGNLWEAFLAQLRAAPSDQLQMNDFEQFTEQARAIVAQKIVDQEKEQRLQVLMGRVQEGLAAMDSRQSYFGFGDREHWSVGALDETALESFAGRLDAMRQHFLHFDELSKSQPSSLDERRIHEQQVRATEDSILGIYRELNQLFVGETLPPAPKPPAEEPPSQPLEAQALMEAVEPAVEPPPAPAPTLAEPVSEEVAEPEDIPAASAATSAEAGTAAPVEVFLTAEIFAPDEPEVYAVPPDDLQAQEHEEQGEPQRSPVPTSEYELVSPAEVEEFLLVGMEEGNLALAYWLALGFEQTGEPVLPSWLLAGIQGTHWFLSQWPDVPQTLLAEIQEIVEPKKRTIPPEQSILALSLALGLGLFENGAGWEGWLSAEIPSSAPSLNTLLIEANTFTQAGLQLEPVIVQNILGKEQVESRIQDLSRQAAVWLEQAPQKGTRFLGADDLWKRIVGSRGTLHTWFDHVAQDDRPSAEKVSKELATWSDRGWLDHHLQRLYREKPNNTKNIDGAGRDQLIFRLLKASDIASQWCDLILESSTENGTKRWRWEQTTQFCDFLKKTLPGSIREAHEIQAGTTSRIERISYSLLEETLHHLAGTMNMETRGRDRISIPFAGSRTLLENLATVLIYYPELSLKENGCPHGTIGQRDLSVLLRNKHSAREAFDLWLNRRNYTFLNTLIDQMPKASQDEASRLMEDRRADDLHILEDEIDKTTVAIEQALVDDLLSEQDYVTAKSNVESIRKQLKSISTGSDEWEAVDFGVYLDRLYEIQKKFESSHEERLEDFKKHWDRLLTLLPIQIQNEEDRRKVVALVERSFRQKDLRAVGEALAHLNNVVTWSEKLALDLFSRNNGNYTIKDFQMEILPMMRALETESMQEEVRRLSRNLKIKERRREVEKALDAWMSLKREENKNRHEPNFPLVANILQYLGWDVDPTSPISLVPQSPTGFQHWRVLANPRVHSPIPQFGSDLKELPSRFGLYDVVGAWGQPGFDSIEVLINHVGKKPALMLYFGRMQASQRLELMKLARKKQHPLIVVDELLMLFLSREDNVRLSAMFDCTLPYSCVNPYTPFATGSVPPEMYFGREDKIAQLEDPYGPCIVYGGRQLGKSALLRQVERNFHNPERGQFAIYEDIRLIGDPFSEKDYRTELADRLVHALRQGEVLEASKQLIDMTRLADILIRQIKTKGWRVLLLIDEADMFMEADAGRKFSAVTILKRVMDQTDRRFKVVFAGLNHVQKFTKTSNQPIAHLGDSSAIKVGPLEPRTAIELIETPLRSLGYVFGKPGNEDPSLIAHILSYTNYHPGLLQLFGQSLVDHLNQKSYGNLHPPYAITRSDIEAVYRNLRVRETIRNRFNITLELDERFEVITLSLILEQWDEKNGFDRLFSPEDLLNLARGNWAAGFGEEITVFKDLLEEMCGLGVLSSVSLKDEKAEQVEKVKYRLRSPNLVSLMGTYNDIFNRLDAISKSQPISQQHKLESYHAPVEPYFSPLTYAQERVIVGSASGVCMVFGTRATHLQNLPESLEKTARTIGDWCELKVAAQTEAALREQLKGLIRKGQKLILAYRELDGTSQEMVEQVLAAARFCRQNRDQKLRIVFSVDAISAWKWFQIPTMRRLELELNYVEVLTTLERWDKLGIRQMLEQHEPEISAGDTAVKGIYEATGGWSNLMDKFIDLCHDTTDPLPALNELKACLLMEREKKEFVADLALYDDHRIRSFLDKVLQEKDLESLTAEEGMDYLFGDENLEQAQVVLEYLRRLSVMQTTPYLRVEPVAARALYEPER